jgi:hypothetical protein
MANILTNFISERLPKHLLGLEALPLPTDVQLALYTSGDGILTDTPTGEVVDTNYARQPVTFDENGLSNPFHFNGLTTLQTITHQALVGVIAGESRILTAIELETPLTPAIGQPIWCEAGKINVSFTV